MLSAALSSPEALIGAAAGAAIGCGVALRLLGWWDRHPRVLYRLYVRVRLIIHDPLKAHQRRLDCWEAECKVRRYTQGVHKARQQKRELMEAALRGEDHLRDWRGAR